MFTHITLYTCFGWVWISGTITVSYMYWTNDKLHVPKWILRKNVKISHKPCKIKVQVYHSSLHDYICNVAKTQMLYKSVDFSFCLVSYIYQFSLEQDTF